MIIVINIHRKSIKIWIVIITILNYLGSFIFRKASLIVILSCLSNLLLVVFRLRIEVLWMISFLWSLLLCLILIICFSFIVAQDLSLISIRWIFGFFLVILVFIISFASIFFVSLCLEITSLGCRFALLSFLHAQGNCLFLHELSLSQLSLMLL